MCIYSQSVLWIDHKMYFKNAHMGLLATAFGMQLTWLYVQMCPLMLAFQLYVHHQCSMCMGLEGQMAVYRLPYSTWQLLS